MSDYSAQIENIVSEGLSNNSCILFVGPELIKIDGDDYYEKFFETLPEDGGEKALHKRTAKYDSSEKIWTFKDIMVKNKFYELFEQYYKKNRQMDCKLFDELARLPFQIIFSLLPDDTIVKAFSKFHNLNISFKTNLDQNVEAPSKDRILIYNIYGNLANNNYVLSHCDYLSFILNYGRTGLHQNIREVIKKARYLIFVGFEFDKWYNILLLYILNEINSGQTKFAIEGQSSEELYRRLADNDDLNIVFIKENCNLFVEELYEKAKVYEKANKDKILRELLTECEYCDKKIKENLEVIDEINVKLSTSSDPREIQKLKNDREYLEKENTDLTDKIKKLN